MPVLGIQTKTFLIRISYQEWDNSLVKCWIQQIRDQIPKVFGEKTTKDYSLYILNYSLHKGFILRFYNRVTAQFKTTPMIKRAEKIPEPLEINYP